MVQVDIIGREFGYTLVTRDARLLEYGEKGHVQVDGVLRGN